MEDMKVSVIIVNYCHPEITMKCINSIKGNSHLITNIIVVDNASPDDSYEFLKNKVPYDVVLIKADENHGFAAGNNIGIKYALENGADYIMLLNNDTEIAPNMISILLQYTNDNIVTAPKMYYYDDPKRIWFAGGKYYTCSGQFKHIGENELDSQKYDTNIECDFLTGCCFMMTAKVACTVGYLDENYFMYVEDVDYSLRLRNEGVKLMMIPKAKLWHKVGVSSGGATTRLNIYYGNRNRFYLQKKFGFNCIIRWITFITRIALIINGVVCNTNQKYIWFSIIDYCANRMGKQESRI